MLDNSYQISRRAALQSTLVTAGTIATSTTPAWAAYIDPSTPKITNRVYFDIDITETNRQGRIIVGLFGEITPRLVENMLQLCQRHAYANTTFYRVVSGLTVQGGAVGDDTGKTGRSSTGLPLEPDNYNVLHNRQGVVSMVRNLNGAVDSRFFITTVDDSGWADDRYAALGMLVEGMDLVHAMEEVQVQQPQNRPKQPIRITDCGIL
jgi:cyclophilin family peptidyl-prolyl cis-trans isomerase